MTQIPLKRAAAEDARPQTEEEKRIGKMANQVAEQYLESMVRVQESAELTFGDRSIAAQMVADAVVAALAGYCLTFAQYGVTALDASYLHRRLDESFRLPRKRADRDADGTWRDRRPINLN